MELAALMMLAFCAISCLKASILRECIRSVYNQDFLLIKTRVLFLHKFSCRVTIMVPIRITMETVNCSMISRFLSRLLLEPAFFRFEYRDRLEGSQYKGRVRSCQKSYKNGKK